MNTLKFITAGSVDDGKSTLIGRLLYDSNSIHTDQLGILKKQSKASENGQIDLSLLTDGLRAEREQGITIDVAYKYFSTKKRKFIIADTPGHEQYTRNMITGASNADLIVLLIDARKGITEQSKRHASIGSLMGIKKAVVAINKMDLMNFSENIFEDIRQNFEAKKAQLNYDEVVYIPVSALQGDNIVEKSGNMPWYKGKALLPYLEEVEITSHTQSLARFQIQWVIRPKDDAFHDYRGYAGLVLSGMYSVGDKVQILPAGIETEIASIERHQKEVKQAMAGENIVLHLKDSVDISRGDSIVKVFEMPQRSNQIKTWLCWFDDTPLNLSKTYLLQHRFKIVRAKIQSVEQKWDIKEWQFCPADAVYPNDIVQVSIKTNQPLFFDAFQDIPANGSAILIDETSYNTVGACMFL
ncbi:MAG: GTP-binding protein [Raineya sp.]